MTDPTKSTDEAETRDDDLIALVEDVVLRASVRLREVGPDGVRADFLQRIAELSKDKMKNAEPMQVKIYARELAATAIALSWSYPNDF